MDLPGGMYSESAGLCKTWAFKPFDGETELSLWDAQASGMSRISAIDAIIDTSCVLGSGEQVAKNLCVTDRYFLLAKLACKLGRDQFWVSHICLNCDTQFDARIDLNQLPVKPAGASYPYAKIKTQTGITIFRVPTGADQAAICDIEDSHAACLKLAQLCCEPHESNMGIQSEDLEQIDQALQEVSPEIATSIQSECPECETQNDIAFDLASEAIKTFSDPLADIHDIASTYHWSEAQILALPRHRRQTYLSLIDAERGMTR